MYFIHTKEKLEETEKKKDNFIKEENARALFCDCMRIRAGRGRDCIQIRGGHSRDYIQVWHGRKE